MKEKIWQWIKKHWKGVVTPIPLLIGIIGLCLDGNQEALDRFFKPFTMYTMDYGDTPPNTMVEIARWGALLVAGGWFFSYFTSLREWIKNRCKNWFFDTIAVYGPAEEQEELLKELGKRGIRGRKKLVKAKRYIFLNDEKESLAFCEEHKSALAGRMLYIRSNMLPETAGWFFSFHPTKPKQTTVC